jgi:Chalcone isomerase-like
VTTPLGSVVGAALGSAELRFFGWHIYTATLWAQRRFESNDYATTPLLLSISYQRPLEGRLIAERSLLEMRRLGAIESTQSDAWLEWMTRAFPNIAAGDTLSGRSDGKGAVEFMHNGVVTARIQDAEFAHRFFGIWLHEATSAPQMRLQLLGLQQSLLKGLK